MRRQIYGILGLVAVAGMVLAPPAAQAGTSGHLAGQRASAPATTITRAITLPARACAALRRSLHNETATCAGHETFRLTSRPGSRWHPAVSRASQASSTYWEGYGTVCGGAPGGPCEAWWVDLHMSFTTSGSQTWNNNSGCSAGGTPLTRCFFTGNGTDFWVLHAFFSTDGFFDFVVQSGDAVNAVFAASSWANHGGSCVEPGNGCYG